MTAPKAESGSFSIPKLRNLLLVVLVVGVAIFTGVMFQLAQRLSDRFGPQVRADLEWRVTRGAQELAGAADLGLAIGDAEIVRGTFGVYADSQDVQAIVAVDSSGTVIAQHGKAPKENLFSGKPGELKTSRDYLVSWSEAQIEGAPVGKVAVVVTTQRLREAQQLLDRSSDMTLAGGLCGLLLGAAIIVFFTRAVALRDAQLSDYAANLERKVDERTRELDERNRGMRLVLDNVAQGFITIDLHGTMASERSAIVDRWFGTPKEGATLLSYLKGQSPKFVEQLDMGLVELRDGIMPVELLLYQMPTRFSAGERTFDASYTPIGNPEAPDRLLVIISDMTEAVAHERAEREQKETMALFQKVASDRAGVVEFLVEGANLVGALRDEQDHVVQQRLVHTLKGNCAIYGLSSYAELAHRVENDLIENGKALDTDQRAELVEAWKSTMRRIGWLLGGGQRSQVQVDLVEIERLVARVAAGATSAEIALALNDWKHEPVHRRLERLAHQAGSVALRLGKPQPSFQIDDQSIRLDGESLAPFWTGMVHVVRNAVDHGIEDPDQRVIAGKPEAGAIALAARRHEGKLVITVSDDGRGVNWEKLREKAKSRGMPHDTREDLVEAMFSDGVSTRDQATDVSGRGVGMAALRQVVAELGGTIEVESVPSQGTTFRFIMDERRSANTNAHRRARASLMPNLVA